MATENTGKKIAGAIPVKAKETLRETSSTSQSQTVAEMTNLSEWVLMVTKASHQYVKDNLYKLVGMGILVSLAMGRRR